MQQGSAAIYDFLTGTIIAEANERVSDAVSPVAPSVVTLVEDPIRLSFSDTIRDRLPIPAVWSIPGTEFRAWSQCLLEILDSVSYGVVDRFSDLVTVPSSTVVTGTVNGEFSLLLRLDIPFKAVIRSQSLKSFFPYPNPRPGQIEYAQEIVDAFQRGYSDVILQGPCGCHSMGTKILMWDGTLERVENIEVGDLVLGPDSKPRRVLKLHRGRQEMARISPRQSKGAPFIVNADHILPVMTIAGSHVRRGSSWRSKSSPLNFDLRYYHPRCSDVSFQCVRVRDIPHLQKKSPYKKFCLRHGYTAFFPKSNSLKVPAYDVGLEISQSCERIPYGCKISSWDDRLNILAAVLDSQGVLAGACRYYLTGSSKRFIHDVAFVARSLGFAANIEKLPASGIKSTASYPKHELLELDELVGMKTQLEDFAAACSDADFPQAVADYAAFCKAHHIVARQDILDRFPRPVSKGQWRVGIFGATHTIPCRKNGLQALVEKANPLHTQFDIEFLPEDDYFGFELDGDHLYLTSDFVVHHNSGKSAIAMTVARYLLFKEFQNGFVATPLKTLQNQYGNDPYFVDHLAVVKGRSAYKCAVSGTHSPACSHKGKKARDQMRASCKSQGICTYYNAIHAAQNHPLVLHNMASLIFQCAPLGFYFDSRDLLVVDECFPPNKSVIIRNGGDNSRDFLRKEEYCSTFHTVYKRWLKGEKLWVKSFNGKQFEWKRITHAWRKPAASKKFLRVTFDGHTHTECTEDHPLLTTKGYVAAKDLTPRSKVICYNSGTSARSDANKTGLLVPVGDLRQVLAGSVLGDGHWARGGSSNAGKRLRVNHGEDQRPYAEFKADLFGVPVGITGKSGYNGKPLYGFRTRHLHTCGMATVEKALSKIDARGLAIWFCDDGSKSGGKDGHRYSATLHTESFTEAQADLAIKHLKSKFGLTAKKCVYRGFVRLAFGVDATAALFDLIAPYVPTCMSYKVGGHPNCGSYSWQGSYADYRLLSVMAVEQGNSYEYCYDLEVEDNHNFVVCSRQYAHSGIVAHNCHVAEDNLLEMFGFTFNQKFCDKYKFQVGMPSWGADGATEPTYEEVLQWLEGAQKSLVTYRAHNENHMTEAEEKTITNRLGNMALCLKNPEEWVADLKPDEMIFKPLDVSKKADLIYGKARYRLWMSATILGKENFARSMGLNLKKCHYIEAPSTFPAVNRPIYAMECFGIRKLNRDKLDAEMPKLIDAIDAIIDQYPQEKGLIHAHTYKILHALINNSKHRHRMRFHDATNREDVLGDFLRSPDNDILVSPSMVEGIDLKDDLGRFQILCKIPWPYLGDAQIRALKEHRDGWYLWKTSLEVVQACGRIVRHETDWGHTYVLDPDFRRWYSNAKELLPDYFKRSVKFVKEF